MSNGAVLMRPNGARPAGGRRSAYPPGAVVWLTGLSGAGKSTIAEHLSAQLTMNGCDVEYLDGDALRALFPHTGFTPAERDAHVRRVGYMASRLERRGVIVIAALISPLRASRAFVRELCSNFIEVYVATPLEVCEARDCKGLYARARRGELTNFTGISDVYEPPDCPEVVIDTSFVPVLQAVELITCKLPQEMAMVAHRSGCTSGASGLND
jgi:adenylylsulfate kinase